MSGLLQGLHYKAWPAEAHEGLPQSHRGLQQLWMHATIDHQMPTCTRPFRAINAKTYCSWLKYSIFWRQGVSFCAIDSSTRRQELTRHFKHNHSSEWHECEKRAMLIGQPVQTSSWMPVSTAHYTANISALCTCNSSC